MSAAYMGNPQEITLSTIIDLPDRKAQGLSHIKAQMRKFGK